MAGSGSGEVAPSGTSEDYPLWARMQDKADWWLGDYAHWPLCTSGGRYALPDDATYASVFGDDDNHVLVQRERDGRLFEVEVYVTITPQEGSRGEAVRQAGA